MESRSNLVGMSSDELVGFVQTLGQPAYRGRQIFGALQQRRLQSFDEISDLPKGILERFEHYFLTYKSLPDEPNKCEIAFSYGRQESYSVIRAAIDDYASLLKKQQ